MEREVQQQTQQEPPDYVAQSTLSGRVPGRARRPVSVQRKLGNQAVQRMVQAKLEISQPGDPYEQEADRVADDLMRNETLVGRTIPVTQVASGYVQRQKCACGREAGLGGECAECRRKRLTLQRQAEGGGQPDSSLSSIESALRGVGQRMDSNTRSLMESRFGHDFGDVRVHTGPQATRAARSVRARAFTMGSDIVFGPGEYAPVTTGGKRLLAHELTHVLQQSGQAGMFGLTQAVGSPVQRDEESTSAASSMEISSSEASISGVEEPVCVAPEMEEEIPEEDVDAGICEEPTTYVGIKDGKVVVLTEEQYEERRSRLKSKMSSLIALGIAQAENGRSVHQWHMEEVRGWAGLLSDWWNDVYPPYIGMWGHARRLLKQAEGKLEEDNIRGAHIHLFYGYESLHEAEEAWRRYLNETIEGAETTVATLEIIRDGAIAIEAGLLTGGTIYGLAGGGSMATVAATLGGVAYGTATAATSETPLGEAVRGTMTEIKNQGIVENLRNAAYGIAGIAYGIGEAFHTMAAGLATLFTDPGQFLEDLRKLPDSIEALWANRRAIWDHFSRLSPQEQAFQVGRFTGHLEAIPIAIETGNAAGAAMAEGVSVEAVTMGLTPAREGAQLLTMSQQIITLQSEAAGLVLATGASPMSIGAYAMGMIEASAGAADKPPAGASPSITNVPKTKSAERERIAKALEEFLDEGGEIRKFEPSPHEHHLFPQEEAFRHHWERLRINIDDYTVWLNQEKHLKHVHGGAKGGGLWNESWHDFFAKHPNATKEQVFMKLLDMRESFGI